jgi:voltage-gated potassium channel
MSVSCTYSNALWLILMTITTVGYGDYFPQTPLGRFIIFFVAIWGTFIVSIMVVVVSNTLKMEKK